MLSPPSRPRFYLGWTVVAVAALSAFTEVAFYNPVLGVFIPEFEREFGWSRTEISAGVTLGSLVGATFAPFFGPLIDRFGGKPFVVGGAAFIALGLALLSQMETEWQFFVIYALGRGTASGLMSLAAGVTVSKWFIRRRGFAVGVMSLGSRIGFAVLPLSVQLIIDASGWRTAALALAGIVVVLGILPAARWLHSRPEAFGLAPDGGVPRTEAGARAVAAAEVNWSRREAVRTRAFWLVTLAVSLQSWAGGAINLHQIPHMVDRGLAPETAAMVLSLLAVFAAAGGLLEGVLDGRIGARWTLCVGLLGSATGMVLLMNVEGIGLALAFAAVYGTAFGLMVASSQVVFADYFGRQALGAIRGAATPAQLGLNAIGPLVAGAAYDLTGSYIAAFVPFTCGYLAAATALAFAGKPEAPARLRVRPAV